MVSTRYNIISNIAGLTNIINTKFLYLVGISASLVLIVYLLSVSNIKAVDTYLITEDFNDNILNSLLWTEAVLGSGPTMEESNQRLEITLPSNSINDPLQHIFRAGYISNCKLHGNFDIQVDFNLPNWTLSNGVRVGLVTILNPFHKPIERVERVSFGTPLDFPGYPREVYLTHFSDGVQGIMETSDLVGKLRLVRNDSSITGYKYYLDNWSVIHLASTSDLDLPFGIFAWSDETLFNNQEVNVHFDNFIINEGELICPSLDVPYFSQLDDSWKDNKYDFQEASISEVGCALSSGTMVMNYHKINSLPDLSELDVENLNQWLIDNPDDSWRDGQTSWTALMRLSTIMNASDSASPILEYQYIVPSNLDEIDRILIEEKDPVILEERSSKSPTGKHFIVANGVIASGSAYSVLDPYDAERTVFATASSELISARYLHPTNTNLSNLVIHTDQELKLLITSPLEDKSGIDLEGIIVNEIDNSYFHQDYPIAFDLEPPRTLGNSFWEFTSHDPVSGIYGLSFDALSEGWYSFELYAYDRDANVKVIKRNIYVNPNNPPHYFLEYTQDIIDNFAVLTKKVDFDSFRKDIWHMFELGHIKKKWLAKTLIRFLKAAEIINPYFNNFSLRFLRIIEWKINAYHPKYIDEIAYELLQEDLTSLKQSIQ